MKKINKEEFEKYFDKDYEHTSENNIIIDVVLDNCTPCELMYKVYQEIEEDYKNITFYKINAEEISESVDSLNIQGFPTFIMFKPGKKTRTLAGLRTKTNFKNNIERYFKDNDV